MTKRLCGIIIYFVGKKIKAAYATFIHYGAGDRGRTGTVSLPLDFESSTSANSITPANNRNNYTLTQIKNQVLFLLSSWMFGETQWEETTDFFGRWFSPRFSRRWLLCWPATSKYRLITGTSTSATRLYTSPRAFCPLRSRFSAAHSEACLPTCSEDILFMPCLPL